MENLTDAAYVRHYLPTAHRRRANGTVEKLSKQVKCTPSIPIWLQVAKGEWPLDFEAVQRIINQSSHEWLMRRNNGMNDKGICGPMEVFGGFWLSPLLSCPSPLRKYNEMNTVKMKMATQLSNMEALHRVLADIRKEVSIRN